MLRVATISESTGRASVFLGAVSAGLIALGFRGVGHSQTTGTTVFEVVVLSSLVFLGTVAFLRCLEIAIDDWEFGVRQARLRATYAELLPQLSGVLATISGGEMVTVMLRGRWSPFQKMLSIAGSVAVLTGVVFGADIGVLAYGVASANLGLAVGIGVLTGATLTCLAAMYQYKRWCDATPAVE
jgi:hypothetical protein